MAGRPESESSGLAGQLDLGVHPVPNSNSLFSGALNTEANIDALLGSLGPNAPLGPTLPLNSEPLAAPATSLNGLNGFAPSNKSLLHVPPPPPPPAATCASLYVKNLPPETDRLWLYERLVFSTATWILDTLSSSFELDGSWVDW